MNDFTNKNATRGGATPSRPTSEGDSSMAADRTLQPIGEVPNHDAVRRMRIELGTSPLEIAAEELDFYRPSLVEVMTLTDCTEHRDLHFRAANFVKDLDNFRALLMERCS